MTSGGSRCLSHIGQGRDIAEQIGCRQEPLTLKARAPKATVEFMFTDNASRFGGHQMEPKFFGSSRWRDAGADLDEPASCAVVDEFPRRAVPVWPDEMEALLCMVRCHGRDENTATGGQATRQRTGQDTPRGRIGTVAETMRDNDRP